MVKLSLRDDDDATWPSSATGLFLQRSGCSVTMGAEMLPCTPALLAAPAHTSMHLPHGTLHAGNVLVDFASFQYLCLTEVLVSVPGAPTALNSCKSARVQECKNARVQHQQGFRFRNATEMYRLTQRGARAAPQCSMIGQSCLLWRLPCGPACPTQSRACPRRGSRCFRTCPPRLALSAAPAQRLLHKGDGTQLGTAPSASLCEAPAMHRNTLAR